MSSQKLLLDLGQGGGGMKPSGQTSARWGSGCLVGSPSSVGGGDVSHPAAAPNKSNPKLTLS